MNTWVRRSLEASIVAAGFVVIGAGVANAAEPAHAAGLPKTDQVTRPATGLVDRATKTAHHLTDGVGATTRHASPAHASPAHATPAHVTGRHPARRVASAHTLPAHTLPGHHTAVHSVTGLVHRTADGLLGQRQAYPMRQRAAADNGAKATHVGKTVNVSRSVDLAPVAGELTGTLSGAGDGSLDPTDPTAPAGWADLSGTGETIGTVTADLGQAGALYGVTDTFGAVDVVGQATGDPAAGDLDEVGAVEALVSSSDEVGGNLGELGSLDGSADVNGVGDALDAAPGSLAGGSLSGVLSATGAADVVTTLDGAIGDYGTVSSYTDLSGLVDASLAALGDLESGDVWAVGTLLGGADGSLDAVAELDGVGTVSVTGAVSGAVDGAAEAAGNPQSRDLSVVPGADGSLDGAVVNGVANLDDSPHVADVTGGLSGQGFSL